MCNYLDYEVDLLECLWHEFCFKEIKLFVRGLMVHSSWDLLLVWPVEFFLAWNAPFWLKLDEYVGRFFISILLKYARRDVVRVVSGYLVYGPLSQYMGPTMLMIEWISGWNLLRWQVSAIECVLRGDLNAI